MFRVFLRVWGFGLRWGFWFKVGVLGFWGFGVLGLGFKGLVKGFGLRV